MWTWPAGKLDLYVAAAGFHPARVLPIVIDVGTDNEALRSDPLYSGLNQPRLTGARYYEVLPQSAYSEFRGQGQGVMRATQINGP